MHALEKGGGERHASLPQPVNTKRHVQNSLAKFEKRTLWYCDELGEVSREGPKTEQSSTVQSIQLAMVTALVVCLLLEMTPCFLTFCFLWNTWKTNQSPNNSRLSIWVESRVATEPTRRYWCKSHRVLVSLERFLSQKIKAFLIPTTWLLPEAKIGFSLPMGFQ